MTVRVLERLIEEHGVDIARYERDFNNMGSQLIPMQTFQRLFRVNRDPRPIITVGGVYTSSYGRRAEQLQEGMIGEVTPETYHVKFEEEVFGYTLRLPLSILRNRQEVSAIIADEMASLMATVNLNVMNLFNNARSTNHKGWDGKPLVDNAHPLVDGAVQDNLMTNALDQAGVEAVFEAYAQLKNLSNVPMGRIPDTLIVPPALMIEAMKIAGSPFVTGSNNNDINVMQGLNVVVANTLTSATRWFATNMADMKRNLRVYFQEPFRIMLNEARVDSLSIQIPLRVVLSWGFINHNWVIGAGA